MVASPGIEAKEVDALTTNVDIHATLADLFGVDVEYITHGKSLLPLVYGEKTEIRHWAVGADTRRHQ